MVHSGDEELFDYLDLDSLVSRYLLDEVVLNYDFGVTSIKNEVFYPKNTLDTEHYCQSFHSGLRHIPHRASAAYPALWKL